MMARGKNKSSVEQLLVQLAMPFVVILVFARMYHSALSGLMTFIGIAGLLAVGLGLFFRLKGKSQPSTNGFSGVSGAKYASRPTRIKGEFAAPVPSPAMEAAIAEAMRPKAPVNPPSDQPRAFCEETLRRLDWLAFEHLVLDLFRFLGFDVRKTQAGADGGVDIELHDRAGQPGNTMKAVIQCKSRATSSVGVDRARELFGVMSAKRVARGILICNTSFTPDAVAFAKDAPGLQLADLHWLQKQLGNLSVVERAQWERKYLGTDYDVPSCPACEIKLVRRTGKQDEFWGCTNYPRGCRSKIPMRNEAKQGA